MTGSVPFEKEIQFDYGRTDRVTPLVRRVIARNPGPFTYTGTGTYIVGHGTVAVIDPGPADDNHIDALQDALKNETVSHILVTHTHRDHSPAAAALKAATGAKTYGFGPHGGPPDISGIVIEEGVDRDFTPDVVMTDGDDVSGPGWTLQALHTPGHTSNHLCFALPEENAVFTGDHIMGWSTTVIAPPDGNMADYFGSLEKMSDRNDAILWPTHGPPVREPDAFIGSLIAHRRNREKQILNCIERGLNRIADIVPVIYADIDKRLHAPAAMSVLAHMVQLTNENRIIADRTPDLTARFSINDTN